MHSGNWIKFYPGDWLSGTIGMTAMERGVYITILMLMYDKEGTIENNTAKLSRLCAMPAKKFTNVLQTLVDMEKVNIENGEISSKKVREILLLRKEKSELAKKSIAARYAKPHQNKENENTDVEKSKTKKKTNVDQSNYERSTIQKQIQNTERTVSRVSTSIHNLNLSQAQPTREREEAGPGMAQGEPSLEEKLRSAADWHHPEPRLAQTAPIQALIDAGADLDLDVLPVVRSLAAEPNARTSWKYFIGPITDAHAARLRAGAGMARLDPPPAATSKIETPAKVAPTIRVYTGSPQWAAWQAYGNPNSPTGWPVTELTDAAGRKRQGWYFPTEWPPGTAPDDAAAVAPKREDAA